MNYLSLYRKKLNVDTIKNEQLRFPLFRLYQFLVKKRRAQRQQPALCFRGSTDGTDSLHYNSMRLLLGRQDRIIFVTACLASITSDVAASSGVAALEHLEQLLPRDSQTPLNCVRHFWWGMQGWRLGGRRVAALPMT